MPEAILHNVDHQLEDVETSVQQIFAEVTRYPLDILELEADLEEDLGIDSVKLGEVFSVLQEKYQFPEDTGVSSEKIRTIKATAEMVFGLVSENKNDVAKESAEENVTEVSSASGGNGNMAQYAVQVNKSISDAVQPSAEGEKPFLGKVAFVTGSGRGLGRTIAYHLGNKGATVIVNSFYSRQLGEETTAEINSAGGKAVHMWGSIGNFPQLHEIFDNIEAQFGGLDFFICNGSKGHFARLEDVEEKHWDRAFRTNVIALHKGALRAAKMMKKRGGGKIIAISTPSAHRYLEYFGMLGPIKAAVESLIMYLSVELAPYNVQLNSVSVGPIEQERMYAYPEKDRIVPYLKSISAKKRFIDPKYVCNVIEFLLSEDANYINGSVFPIEDAIALLV